MRAISLPFRIDGYGRVAYTSDDAKINQARVRSALLTPVGGRLMRPTFGTAITARLFATYDEAIEDIEVAAVDTFAEVLPDLAYESFEVVSEDPESGRAEINITYSAAQSPSQTVQTFVLDSPQEDV